MSLGGKIRLDYNIVRHGYGIAQNVYEDSGGRLKLGAGTLYGTLRKLQENGLIEEVPYLEDGTRRVSYRLTKNGWDRLTEELGYYEKITRLARERGLI